MKQVLDIDPLSTIEHVQIVDIVIEVVIVARFE
jgi:hypothetical protein